MRPVRFDACELDLGGRRYDLRRRCLVMGIVNRTPDSFYDKGRHFDLATALAHAGALVDAGADVVDVGGVKAGPGEAVSPEDEIRRVAPVIEAVVARHGVPVSVDTFQPAVARAALAAGACLVNDVSGLGDAEMVHVAARAGAGVVVCHIQGRPRVANPDPVYGDLRGEVLAFLREGISRARAAGIPAARIVTDNGLDLCKSPSQSLELLAHTADLARLGHPVLLSASNKGFLGALVGTGVDDRWGAGLGALVAAVTQGARIVRVHDVAATVAVVRTVEALLAEGERAVPASRTEEP